MTNTKMLQELIKKSGLKLQYIADELGISRMALNNKINNLSQFKSGEISKLCVILKIESLAEKECLFFAKEVAETATL